MNIGSAAARSGLPAKTIRYYEEIGLVQPERRPNGYRDYRPRDVLKLLFLRRARGLGFSIEDCREILSLYEPDGRPRAEARALASARVAEIDAKMRELAGLRSALARLAKSADNGSRKMPSLEDLVGEPGPGPGRDRRRSA